MQQNYFTPIKNIQSYNRQLFNSDSIHRQGDWVCLNCQNLNYSFRKKCNRCKTQSRQQNQKHSVYSYYYWDNNKMGTWTQSFQKKQIGVEHQKINFEIQKNQIQQFIDQNKENQICQWNAVLQTPKKKKPLMSAYHSKLDGLPSVSPLIKKYRQKQHHTTLEKLRNQTNFFQSSEQSKDFEQIKIRDFDKLIQDLSFTNGGKTEMESSPFKENLQEEDLQGIKFMKQMEESISRIII